MKHISLMVLVCLLFPLAGHAQKQVTFETPDGMLVTADLYRTDRTAPVIILLHREGSSRGEYRDIAPKLMKMGFSCLAVDLCYGKECNYIRNETAAASPCTMLESEKVIAAAIDYVAHISIKKRSILMGSNFSASLAMKVANHNPSVTAVVAMSPGEYFGESQVKTWLKGFDHPLLVMSTKQEAPFVTELLQHVPKKQLTRYIPTGDGVQGAPALWGDDAEANDYWMVLMVFLNKVKGK